jgi:hypothetical protein
MSVDDGHIVRCTGLAHGNKKTDSEVLSQRVSYQDVHRLIGKTSDRIKEQFSPDIMIAIGGGSVFARSNANMVF